MLKERQEKLQKFSQDNKYIIRKTNSFIDINERNFVFELESNKFESDL